MVAKSLAATDGSTATQRRWSVLLLAEPLLWFVGCLVLYVALAEPAFYKTDGPDIVRLLDEHRRSAAPLLHPWHCGYLPALHQFGCLLSWLGLSPGYLQLGAWFSALGVALGVAALRAGAARLGLAASTARLAALSLALSPGALLFGTVVEFHGPLLGMTGLCFLLLSHLVVRPSWWALLALGGLCHLTFLIDGQALFLPLWLALFFLARRWPLRQPLQDLARMAGLAAVHALLFFLLPRLWPQHYGFWADLAAGLQTESSIGRPQTFDYAPQIFWQEWLQPLLPLSVMVFLALRQRALRGEFLAFLLGAVPFFILSVRQLVDEPEYGAYMLPMLLPAALLVAQSATARLRRRYWLLLLVGLLPWQVLARPPLRAAAAEDAAFAAAVATAAAGKQPFVLVGSARELASAYARLQPDELLWVRQSAALPRQQATPAHFQGMVLHLRMLLGSGRAVLVTEIALASLQDPRSAMLAEKSTLVVPDNEELAGPLFAAALREHFELVPAADGMLRLTLR